MYLTNARLLTGSLEHHSNDPPWQKHIWELVTRFVLALSRRSWTFDPIHFSMFNFVCIFSQWPWQCSQAPVMHITHYKALVTSQQVSPYLSPLSRPMRAEDQGWWPIGCWCPGHSHQGRYQLSVDSQPGHVSLSQSLRYRGVTRTGSVDTLHMLRTDTSDMCRVKKVVTRCNKWQSMLAINHPSVHFTVF